MDIYVLDKDFNTINVVDYYESVLWIDRFKKPGEFELYTYADKALINYLSEGNYLKQKDSDHVQIVECVKIETDAEDGNHATFTGRSLESILDRRIIWKQTDFDNVPLQDAVKKLLDENIINPSVYERKIPNFIFSPTNDETILKMTLTAQYTGNNLLEVITDICEDKQIGFKITLNEYNQFVFELYSGMDRSYEQYNNPFVVFSPDFDNIIDSNYIENYSTYKNVSLVAGDGEGLNRKTFVVGIATGLSRKEIYTDARDISSTDENGNEISDSVYNEKLKQRGLEKLSSYSKEKTFDGNVDPYQTFSFGKDFFMGDVVQIKNEYGIEGAARIIEYVMSDSASKGPEYYPTFEAIKEMEV